MPRTPRNSRQPPNDQRRPRARSTAVRTHTSTTSANGPFYGRQRIAETCSKFLVAAFDAPRSSLVHFIARALHRTRSADFVACGALILLERIKEIDTTLNGELDPNPSGHRELFMAALKVASESFAVPRRNGRLWAVALISLQVNESNLNETERVLRSVFVENDDTTTISRSDLDTFFTELRRDPNFNRFRH